VLSNFDQGTLCVGCIWAFDNVNFASKQIVFSWSS